MRYTVLQDTPAHGGSGVTQLPGVSRWTRSKATKSGLLVRGRCSAVKVRASRCGAGVAVQLTGAVQTVWYGLVKDTKQYIANCTTNKNNNGGGGSTSGLASEENTKQYNANSATNQPTKAATEAAHL